MKIEKECTVISLEGDDDHRALRLAVRYTIEAINTEQRRFNIPLPSEDDEKRTHIMCSSLVRAGADPLNIHDLVSLRDILERLEDV